MQPLSLISTVAGHVHDCVEHRFFLSKRDPRILLSPRLKITTFEDMDRPQCSSVRQILSMNNQDEAMPFGSLPAEIALPNKPAGLI
jgi:hypothetical protein